MRQIFQDHGEIDHVIYLIEEQWNDTHRNQYEMRTAKCLADFLRDELLSNGNTEPSEIVDANEIVFWYLDKRVSPDMWQYAFADCLASLLLYFYEPAGITDDVYERLERNNQINDLREKCVKVLHADLARISAAKINRMTPFAETGRKTILGGKLGHEKVYGDQASKDAERKLWQEWVNEEIEQNPNLSFEKIKKNVEKKKPVSVHQLKRHTQDPRKKT
ncbi:hypothetical protein [Nitrosomonas marina]|uniref:Uncharacterized protein n=1 Tax=Nitrosomonas marina TaxID=917 RepID=A0A1H8I534_9PROT|nr:hypothetical protein [Nitrosomonas marina]SEN63599.1 hypothetical protein SAMN05216325_12912 [Nitrosomonas marina]